MNHPDKFLQLIDVGRCIAGRQNHRYEGDGVKIWCRYCKLPKGQDMNERHLPVEYDPPKLVKTSAKSQSATEIKLECVTDLVKAYDQARSLLKKFLSQQGIDVGDDSQLASSVSEYLDQLYKEHGRDKFWEKNI